MFLGTIVCAALGVGAWFLHPAVITVPALLLIWLFSFFRDPNRRIPDGERAIVSPADGTVTDITVVDDAPYIDGRAHMVGIFLSVFNAHINRAPVAGTVERVEHKEGKYHDARSEACRKENERNDVILDTPLLGKVVVRQISGAVARRIVCPVSAGTELARGEKFGMIKFGSRTELYFPADTEVEWSISVGQAIKAGSTLLGTAE
jgi:phosphatidylserine decarboxylase